MIARTTASARRPGEPPAPPAACTLIHLLLLQDVAGRLRLPALGAPRWLTPPKGPARGCGHQRGRAAAAGNDDRPRQPPPASRPSPRRGSPACVNPAAAAARPADSRRRRTVAAATPAASGPGPTATWLANAGGRASMATPDTCAAHTREPASTIIEGAGRRNETRSPASGQGPPTLPRPFRCPAPALRTCRRAHRVLCGSP